MNWKEPYYRALEESILQPRDQNKPEREKWVVGRLLEVLCIPFQNGELVVGEEPVDIEFRNARFQVKELLEEDYRRGDKLKKQRKAIDLAQSLEDLIESYTSWSIPWQDIVFKVEVAVKKLTNKYGPSERASLDLLFYFNYSNNEISGPFNKILANGEVFRSVSLVTNSYCGVLFADPNSPEFLHANAGKIIN
ncbi:MAG: DUF1780 domain-containing protein [Nitrospirae bacterium]|nr:DUF1780 domain-containing protein [Nitrospirota bacterium]MDA1303336.1 DUF1780 domain-containing protein [Nitrospirota bacterium]